MSSFVIACLVAMFIIAAWNLGRASAFGEMAKIDKDGQEIESPIIAIPKAVIDRPCREGCDNPECDSVRCFGPIHHMYNR